MYPPSDNAPATVITALKQTDRTQRREIPRENIMQIIADFRVQQKAELYEKINAAVAAAISDGIVECTRGILVTRHNHDHFSVALSPSVPFGLIHEQDQNHQN